jgi:hypothetical protein
MIIYNEIEFYPIPDYEAYFISKCGKVLSTRGNKNGSCDIKYTKILKPTICRGYNRVGLFFKNNKKFFKTVHRLVAMTFLKDYNEILQVDHKDNNKLNNNLKNLRMVTHLDIERHKKTPKHIKKIT